MNLSREYERSHSHITFGLDLRAAPPSLWAQLGEAKSKSQHVARALLSPTIARELMEVYLAKGVLATTAIEGNTLSEDEVRDILEGRLQLPPSREYLQTEIENVIAAYNESYGQIVAEPDKPLTVAWLERFNELILDGLELEDGVVPGELRTSSVVVGTYRAAPARNCEYLLERLCEWLNGSDFEAPSETPELAAPLAIVKAIIGHLYIAWIHPFGDGNGRTARLLELQILIRAGFPAPACQLLSNHYNLTRSAYSRQLDSSSRAHDEISFLNYATQGLIDQLREQLGFIRLQQLADRWEQFVYQTFGGGLSESGHRRLRVVLAVSRTFQETGEPVLRSDVPTLTAELAGAYSSKTQKTLTRDLNAIAELGLIHHEGRGLFPADEKIRLLEPEVKDGVLFP